MADQEDEFMAKIRRLQAARATARQKVSEILGQPSKSSERALRRRQRAARRAIEEALSETMGAKDCRDMAIHLTEWFEWAAIVAALQLDPARFSRDEVEVGISDLLTSGLRHLGEAALLAGYPLPYTGAGTTERKGR